MGSYARDAIQFGGGGSDGGRDRLHGDGWLLQGQTPIVGMSASLEAFVRAREMCNNYFWANDGN